MTAVVISQSPVLTKPALTECCEAIRSRGRFATSVVMGPERRKDIQGLLGGRERSDADGRAIPGSYHETLQAGSKKDLFFGLEVLTVPDLDDNEVYMLAHDTTLPEPLTGVGIRHAFERQHPFERRIIKLLL